MKKIVIILGPTAVGKSEIGINLAKEFNGEIISADSVQIYRGLDVGSAKVTIQEMQGVVHHCIDILAPQSEFSVFEFVEITKQKIDEIISRGKTPFIVGGTGLYIRALLGGYDFGGSGKQEDFRKQLEEESKGGLENLYSRLKSVAPERAERIEPTDKKRIIRGLEIAEFGQNPTQTNNEYDAFVINLSMDRERLYNRINLRTDIMLQNGLIDEVKRLINQGVSKDSQSMKAIGYKEVISYLNGEIDRQTMTELIKQHSRNYAKRQMTFFRSLKDAHIVNAEDKELAKQILKEEIREWL